MSEHLSVSVEGLHTASADLHEHARLVLDADSVAAGGDKPSTAGAGKFAAAIKEFSTAYAGRLTNHAAATSAAAASYSTTDRGAATDITATSV